MGFSVSVKELIGDKITCVAGDYLVVEGHKGISEYSSDGITIRIKGGTIKVKGVALVITEINGEEIYISGKISDIERSSRRE